MTKQALRQVSPRRRVLSGLEGSSGPRSSYHDGRPVCLRGPSPKSRPTAETTPSVTVTVLSDRGRPQQRDARFREGQPPQPHGLTPSRYRTFVL